MHLPVMPEETLDLLAVRPDGIYLDGTLGGGGHARRIAERLGPTGRLIGMDRDPAALERCRSLFEGLPGSVDLVQANFSSMRSVVERFGIQRLDGVLLDLGFSSFQVDEPARGFSFMRSGPLDMRMDPGGGMTAAELVNTWSEAELADLIFEYGEERNARRIARTILEARAEKPFETTTELAELIEKTVRGRGRIHPATRTFQALRMAVNEELPSLRKGLQAALELLAPGGRLAVITFHSLEDRLVKKFFRAHEVREESLPQGGVRKVFEVPPVRRVNRRPIAAGLEEIAVNPRARSARLRAVERRRDDED